MKTTVGVLLSGEGTNFQAIVDDTRKPDCPYRVGLVVSNIPTAHGLERARKADVPAVVVRHQDYPSREAFENELAHRLKEKGVDLVVLAGFMRILTKKFVDHFRGKVMNIHPALLPSFPGTGALQKAWEMGVRVTGVTVHFVDEGVDTGPIILQQALPIQEGENFEDLTAKIHQLEHQLYPRAIRLFAEGRLKIEGKKVLIL